MVIIGLFKFSQSHLDNKQKSENSKSIYYSDRTRQIRFADIQKGWGLL